MPVAVGARRAELRRPAPAHGQAGRIDGGITLRRHGQAGQPQPHLSGGAGLPGVAAAEDDVLHPVAAEALGALLPEDPRDRVGDVALAAAVRADDGGHALVEGKLRAVGKRLKTVYFEAFEAHMFLPRPDRRSAGRQACSI